MTTIPIISIHCTDSRYPPLLREITDPPEILYMRGTGSKISLTRTIAVIGTRQVTQYGIHVTKLLVTQLVVAGFTIVSGMAIGVDTVAHQAAIDAGGKTIAVLGCGVDIIWPPSNTALYEQIIHGHGAVVSEITAGTRTSKAQFLTRNRIISGLSLGVLVIEGAEQSGTLATARYASIQGREVFAVPGPITSRMSRAPAILLKNGAKLVESARDIIDEL